MELKKGMRVKVVKDVDSRVGCAFGWNDIMEEWLGATVTITDIIHLDDGRTKVKIAEDGGEWCWGIGNFEIIEKENENMKELATLMNKESSFTLDEEKMREWVDQAMVMLGKFNYDPSEFALEKIFKEWAKAKGWVIDLFAKHPKYNGNGQIIIPASLKRPIHYDGINIFRDWFDSQVDKMWLSPREIRVGFFTLQEVYDIWSDIDRICDRMYNFDDSLIYRGKTKEEWYNEREHWSNLYATVQRKSNAYSRYVGDRRGFFTNDDLDMANAIKESVKYATYVDDEESGLITEEKAVNVNNMLEKTPLKVRAVVGQKITKLVGKIMKELGFNKIVDIQLQEWWTDGTYHSREKDMGYNYHFALLGDSINPITYTRDIVISVNPMDFWSMSFGHNWTSCHTIDKEGIRGNISNNYSGCYSGGTESYMLDGSSIIVYIRPTEDEIIGAHEQDLPMEEQGKLKRVLFFLGEDKLVQSRVYPDGRDGGDKGLASQLRNIMQKTIADLYETPNMWTLKKGRHEVGYVTYTEAGAHYRDYEEYDDVNVSYLRRIDGQLNTKTISIGAEHICPSCGAYHEEEAHITCYDCFNADHKSCDRCGVDINLNTDDYIEIEGYYYCCETCAFAAGYRWCEDAEEWRWYEDVYQDTYNDLYYAWDDDAVITEEGNWYHNEDNARRDGYEYSDADGEWYNEEYLCVDHNGYTFCMDRHEDAIEIDGEWYLSEDEARDDGYVLNEDNEWVAA